MAGQPYAAAERCEGSKMLLLPPSAAAAAKTREPGAAATSSPRSTAWRMKERSGRALVLF